MNKITLRIFEHECVKCDKPMGTTKVNIKDLDRMAEENVKEHICTPCRERRNVDDEVIMRELRQAGITEVEN